MHREDRGSETKITPTKRKRSTRWTRKGRSVQGRLLTWSWKRKIRVD
jgi:hypothetical protein